MALGFYSNFQIDPVFMDVGYTDTTCENGNKFNANSNGTITLSSEFMGGHGKDEYFWDFSQEFVYDRDPASAAAVTIDSYTDKARRSPKLNTRIGPIGFTLDAWKKRQACNTRGGVDTASRAISLKLGMDLGENLMRYRLRATLGALVAALNTEPAIQVDDNYFYGNDSGGAGFPAKTKPEAFIEAMSKLGECEGDLAAVIVPTAVRHLLRQELSQRDSTFNFPGFQVYPVELGGRVLPMIVSDNVALQGPAAPPGTLGVPGGGQPTYYALLLRNGAARVTESEETSVAAEVETGNENLRYVVQAETATTVDLLGFDFIGPTVVTATAMLTTGANWDYVYSDIKRGPGSIIWLV